MKENEIEWIKLHVEQLKFLETQPQTNHKNTKY
jgi:hypothetical protein